MHFVVLHACIPVSEFIAEVVKWLTPPTAEREVVGSISAEGMLSVKLSLA